MHGKLVQSKVFQDGQKQNELTRNNLKTNLFEKGLWIHAGQTTAQHEELVQYCSKMD